MKYLGDLEQSVRQFGETCLTKYVGDLEKTCLAIWRKCVRRFGENAFGENVGDLEKRGRRSYGDFILVFVKLGDRKWRLNHNGEKIETNYGDKNFIHHRAENTYLEHFKDRNV